MASGPPRHVLMRASLRRARVEDEEPKVCARSDTADANRGRLAKLKDIAQSAETPSADIGANWDHRNARYGLRSTEAVAEAFAYIDEQPLIAATFVAADFHFPGAFDVVLVELFSVKVLLATNARISG